jgi:hypothetical protein
VGLRLYRSRFRIPDLRNQRRAPEEPEPDQFDQIQEISAVIDWAIAENDNIASPLHGLIDPETIAVSGHSLGGHVTMWSAIADSRIDTAVIIDAWFDISEGGFGQVDVPVMFLNSWVGLCGGHGLPVKHIYDVIDVPRAEIAVVDSAHIDFLERSDGLNALGQVICGGGTRDKNEVRAIAQRYLVAWLNVYLKGLTDFEDIYAGASAQADIDANSVTIRHDL